MENKPKRILILSSADSTFPDHIEINEDFVQRLRSRLGDDIALEWHNYHDIRIEFGTDKFDVYLKQDETPLSSFDFVYIKSYFRHSELAGAIATYLDIQNIKYVCTELRNHLPLTKLTQFVRLAVGHLPIAHSVYMLTDQFIESYDILAAKLGAPFIFKSIAGGGGFDNFLIKNEEEFHAALSQGAGLTYTAQTFIENDSDLRVLIVGGKIELIIKRQRKDNSTHLNNTSQGADAFLLPVEEFPEADKQLCLKAAEVMGREIAGVDLLYEAGTGNPYLLEVNASPQVASGAFTEEKLDIYSNFLKNMVQ